MAIVCFEALSAPIIPRSYNDLLSPEFVADFNKSSNIRVVPRQTADGNYFVHVYVGDTEVGVPFYLSKQEYSNWQLRIAMQRNFRKLSNSTDNVSIEEPIRNIRGEFSKGTLQRIFGAGGVRIKTTGNISVKTGITTTYTSNPALALWARRKTRLDFDQRINAGVSATVGSKLKFELNYNTDATFDFDAKRIKLAYNGEEDDVVKMVEVGNISVSTGSSLVRGASSLFGVKTGLQFGPLNVTAFLSQQNSETRSVGFGSGGRTTDFTVSSDSYDANRHFFLAHYFRENYDHNASRLPLSLSGIRITRMEVWVTNKTNDYGNSRNIVAFADMGESSVLSSDYWAPDARYPMPSNNSNNLLPTIERNFPGARNINNVTGVLAPLAEYGIEGGRGYEKIESARKLNEAEYALNTTLGYISLQTPLAADEVLGVAFEYSLNGVTYKVGEFSSDVSTTADALYVKMLRNASPDTRVPLWKLMMKNVYSLGTNSIDRNNFQIKIKYISDSTRVYIDYLPVASVSDRTLLQVMNLDRLDASNDENSDGFFDYIPGYTILPDLGCVVFPEVEPFGSHLRKALGGGADAERFIFPEIYDSTMVAAKQFTWKNRFVITGTYKGSSGAQINLGAVNVQPGSVIVMAGGVKLTENSDYVVDYTLGTVTILNRSIVSSGQQISVTLENNSLFSTRRKTLTGVDLQYAVNRNLTVGGQLFHYSEKAFNEKVAIGNERVANTMAGVNLAYNAKLPWLNDLLNAIPTVSAKVPSQVAFSAEYARLLPKNGKPGSENALSYIDDFETAQTGYDLRSPYAWTLASAPYDNSANALFPESTLSDNADYGKNRALLNWYTIDRVFTSRNSSLCPSYLRADLKQQSNPYIREITWNEIFPDRQLQYGEQSTLPTLNLSFYPSERGPYNLDAENVDSKGQLLNPEKRWGGIMRKLDSPDFETSNVEYISFWLLNPFLDPESMNTDGGDLYFNLGDISEDILKDGMKSYENGIAFDGDNQYMKETVWGRVNSQSSLTYSFDNLKGSRLRQDVGLDGLSTKDEFTYSTYRNFVERLRGRLSSEAIAEMENDGYSPLCDPAGDNYHFFLGEDYDRMKLGILERYKRYNGVEGNSLSPDDVNEPMYQPSKNVPDVEDINQDNTLNEYERYFQYRVSIRPKDFVVGKNFITDRQKSMVMTRSGEPIEVEWFQFKIPVKEYEKSVGSISDFSSIRFARIFMHGFTRPTHLRFATLELVRGDWRTFDLSLKRGTVAPAEGELEVSSVSLEENSSREPVNYVLPPGVSRMIDSNQQQMVQLNEQSMELNVSQLPAGETRAVYKTVSLDLRNYRRLGMFVHCETPVDATRPVADGDFSAVLRLGTDIKDNYYEYSVPLVVTPDGKYNGDVAADRYAVWPVENKFDVDLRSFVNLKRQRNKELGTGISLTTEYTVPDPLNARNKITVTGNPSLADIRVMTIGVRNNTDASSQATVWFNELSVTEIDDSGGSAAKANMNLSMSDIATFNVGANIETTGFGAVDQSVSARRNDTYKRFDFAMQVDAGRFLPESMKLRAPVFYSVSREQTTPRFNPFDTDVPLSESLNDAHDSQARDSILAYAIERGSTSNFSLAGMKFDVHSAQPKPWDPGNFTLNIAHAEQKNSGTTVEYEKISDSRVSLQYLFMPQVKSINLFGKNSSGMFDFRWLPNSITFMSTISRHYYENQIRPENDTHFKLPVSVNKNFIWDRSFGLVWNFTQSLTFSLLTNTSARIEEPVGAVNRNRYPQQYREWRKSVTKSLLRMGTPHRYNQTVTLTYNAPFTRIPVLSFLSSSATYSATYIWERGAKINGLETGNIISNNAVVSIDSRANLETFYARVEKLADIDRKYRGRQRTTSSLKSFRRTFLLHPDSSLIIHHNLMTRNVVVRAKRSDGSMEKIESRVIDRNKVEVRNRGDYELSFIISEQPAVQNRFIDVLSEQALRFAMSVRSVGFRWRKSDGLTLPLFKNDVGNFFGQSGSYGPLSPGVGFAFGFTGNSFVRKAMKRNWLLTDNGETSPAIRNVSDEMNLEINLEPIRGFKVLLFMNRSDSRSTQTQFMFENLPPVRSGSYSRTHIALSSAFGKSTFKNGYKSAAFSKLIENVPIVAARIERMYGNVDYPTSGFMNGNPYAGEKFDAKESPTSPTNSDVLIPAFISAYSGISPKSVNLNPFPSFSSALPNWRISYEGLTTVAPIANVFKTLAIHHSYQCEYNVGAYSSWSNWIGVGGDMTGFVPSLGSGAPQPASAYNISSVAISENFAPLIGVRATLKNDIMMSAEYADTRVVTLNTSAGQVIEATRKMFTFGGGYRITGFNTFIRHKGKQTGVSNDLTLNADFSLQKTSSLVRRIESNYTQATSGTNGLNIAFNGNYVVSRSLTVGAYVNYNASVPVISSAAYPVTTISYGLTLNLSLKN